MDLDSVLAAFSSVDAPESITTIVLGCLAVVIPAILKAIQKITKKESIKEVLKVVIKFMETKEKTVEKENSNGKKT